VDYESEVAVYDSVDNAAHAVRALADHGFPADQVALIHSPGDSHLPTQSLRAGDESENKAAAGAAAGGLVGMLVGAPLLAIPGVGPLLLAAPVATGMTGALVGGFLGSMSGWGVHSDHVGEYERMVRSGKVLVVAHGDPTEIARAEQLLRETHPVEMHLHAPDDADSEEIVRS